MSFDIVMGKRYIAISYLMLLFLAACGENGDKSVSPDDEPVSVENSSSSEKLSSSSVILSASEESSSSLAKSSSSSIQKNSSSSEMATSSSSKDEKKTKESSSSAKSSSSSSVFLSASEESSSSSASLPNCSALLEGETGWSWDVPKECRFNPNIDYGTMTDERDGKVYRTVKIGDQVWMAENLNFDPGQGGSGEDKYDWSWCYDNEPKNCDVAGRYYTWAAAIDSVKLANDVDNPQDCGYYGKTCGLLGREQGVCPMGWHLPSGAEIEILLTAVGVQDKEKYWQWQGAGIKLKSISGWKDDDSESGNGTDSFGFSALPTGDGHNDGSYHDDGEKANFWSSTETTSGSAYGMYMNNNYDVAKLDYGDKRYGFSVRCVKDAE